MSAPNGSSRTTRSSGLATASSSSTSTPANNGSKTSLFRNHFMKRPNNNASAAAAAAAAAAAITTPASANDPESMRMDVEMQHQQQQRCDTSSDLVVRDKNGDAEVGNPPPLVVDDEDELQALEIQLENEREKKRLTEALRLYRINHSSIAHQPDALFEAVRESNRSKVSALAEDNWMFEPEEQPRIS
ncbi:hypothetical protein J3F83DRAFT_489435 [Trichoderma novae-zelandiae]